MSKFNSLYNAFNSQLDVVTEAIPGQQPTVQTNQAPGSQQQPQVPAPHEQEPTQDVTSEGKKFMVELALQALSVDPANLSAADKQIFTTQVSTENAEQVLERIRSIVDLYS